MNVQTSIRVRKINKFPTQISIDFNQSKAIDLTEWIDTIQDKILYIAYGEWILDTECWRMYDIKRT